MRILIWDTTTGTGVSKFRLLDPNVLLSKKHQDIFRIDFATSTKQSIDLSGYDMLVMYGNMAIHPSFEEIYKAAKENNTKVVLDVDDYWMLDSSNGVKTVMDKNKITLLNGYRKVDAITTSTPQLYQHLKRYNNNVYLLPNTIRADEWQFKPKKVESEMTRVGWAGGSTHLHDLKLLSDMVLELRQKKLPVQLCLAGFNNMVIDINTKQMTKVKVPPVWANMEAIFTNNYQLNDNAYRNHLLKFSNEFFPSETKQEYRRFWSKGIDEYATVYNNFDIVLAPLKETAFNQCKSELKMLEAGAFSLPVVCSDVMPYQTFTHGQDCLKVKEKRSHKDWFKSIKRLCESKELRMQIGQNLNSTLQEKYNAEKWAVIRKDIYLKIGNG